MFAPVMDGPTAVPRRRALGVLLVLGSCVLLFIAGVSLRINGSSSAIWLQDLHETDQRQGIILGTPKATRSDEWMVWTPAILSQLHHETPLPLINRSLGPGVAPLLMNMPVRHYSMIFRPQLWGFFFLDAEHAFAWLWNAKIFGLLTAFFLLFLVLLGGRIGLAVLGSIAISYSSYVQWWFSSPPMLPEMLSSWAVALTMGWVLFSVARTWIKIGAAILLVAAGINFLLCGYPPFQVPLAYLALFLLAAFLWQRRHSSLRSGLLWLSGCGIAAALLVWPLFDLCRPTLQTISQTSYPGMRRNFGGQMAPLNLISGLLNFYDGEHDYAEGFANASEASNFFPLWVAAVGLILWRFLRNRERSQPIVAALLGCIVLFSAYAILGVPEWFGRWTGLGFCMPQRSLLAIGVAGMLLVFHTLCRDGPLLIGLRSRLFATIGAACAIGLALVCAQAQAPNFLSIGRTVLLIATATGLAAAYFSLKPQLFASIFAAALILNNFLVNPINQGLPAFSNTAAAKRFTALHQAHPDASWAVYEQSRLAQYLISTGATVVNGVKSVPDLELLRQLDPSGDSIAVYNRYAFIILGLPQESGAAPRFEPVIADIYRAYINPLEPALRSAGLKYVVFRRPLGDDEIPGVRLVDSIAQSKIWIYELP